MSRIAYYVSGHGYGHAVRARQVIEALVDRGATVLVRSNAAPEAFAPLPAGALLEEAPIDVGVLQRDSLVVDEAGTLDAFERFWSTRETRIAEEVSRIGSFGADVVVADIAPLAIEIANRRGVPSVVVANFTWDWIYRSWSDRDPRAGVVADRLHALFQRASVFLATPLNGGLEAFRAESIPLIVRRARRPRPEVRRELGLGEGDIAVLVAFGGLGPPDLAPPRDADPEMRFLGYTQLGWPLSRYQLVDRRSVPHPDLVAASDVVLGKPGYGTVAECLAHGTPMAWVGRERFPELAVLVRGLAANVGAAEVDSRALRSGDIGAVLRRALAAPGHPLPVAELEGARVAAERILALLPPGATALRTTERVG